MPQRNKIPDHLPEKGWTEGRYLIIWRWPRKHIRQGQLCVFVWQRRTSSGYDHLTQTDTRTDEEAIQDFMAQTEQRNGPVQWCLVDLHQSDLHIVPPIAEVIP